jgi:hypothetical protein
MSKLSRQNFQEKEQGKFMLDLRVFNYRLARYFLNDSGEVKMQKLSVLQTMKNLAATLVLLSLFTATLRAETAADKLARLALPSVVTVRGETEDGKSATAAGVLITGGGYFICTDHAILGAKKLFVKVMGWTEEKEAQFIIRDAGSRLVLMRINAVIDKGLPHAKFNYLATPPKGTEYLLLSFYGGKEQTEASTGKLGELFEPLREYGIEGAELFSFEGLRLPKEYHALCTGGPILSASGQFLGIASFLFGNDTNGNPKKALCYVIPTSWILAFCAAVADDKTQTIHGKILLKLPEMIGEAEKTMDLKQRVNFRQTKTMIIERLIAVQKKLDKQIAEAQEANMAARVSKMSREGKAIHNRHKDWHPDIIDYICKRELKKGMTGEMITEMFGEPQKKNSKSENGIPFTEWMYHNTGAFGSIEKGQPKQWVFNTI